MPVREALLIATSEHKDKSIPALTTPPLDVKDLEAILQDPNIGGFRVTTLINQPADILRRKIGGFFSKRHADDFLLLYFSGHGLREVVGPSPLVFAAADTERELLLESGVSAEDVHSRMLRCNAKRQVLILDCCFAGAFMSGAKGPVDITADFPCDGTGQVILAATSSTKRAFEGQAVSSSAFKHSLFTHFLLEGFKSGAADENGSGMISVDGLFRYAERELSKLNIDQKPQIDATRRSGSLDIGRNPVPRAQPEKIPLDLRESAISHEVHNRLHAAQSLARFLSLEHAGRALAARELLEKLAADDSKNVSRTAREALGLPQVEAAQLQVALDDTQGQLLSLRDANVRLQAALDQASSSQRGAAQEVARLEAELERIRRALSKARADARSEVDQLRKALQDANERSREVMTLHAKPPPEPTPTAPPTTSAKSLAMEEPAARAAVSQRLSEQYKVELQSAGVNVLQVIRTIRQATGFDLTRAKGLVDAVPHVVKSRMTRADAHALLKELEAAGAAAHMQRETALSQ